MEWVSKVRYKIITILPLLIMMTAGFKTLAETYALKVDVPGCSTIEAWKEAIEYGKAKDFEAFQKLFGVFGPCSKIKAGTKFDVYERNKELEIPLMLVRPYGTRFKLWIVDNHWDFDMGGGNK